MTTRASIDPIIARFRAALGEVYGERLERVVLFGSRARGDARPDSDYDVAVFCGTQGACGRKAGRLLKSRPKFSWIQEPSSTRFHFPLGTMTPERR